MADSQYTLVIKDGAVVLVRSEPSPPTAAGFFLVLLLTLGACLNAALLVGLSSPQLRGAGPARLLLAQLSCACLLDCALDAASSAAVLLLLHLGVPAGGEARAQAFCRANAALQHYVVVSRCDLGHGAGVGYGVLIAALRHYVVVVEGVVVAGLAVQRAAVLRGLRCGCKRWRTRCWLLLVWGCPAALVLPLAVGGVVAARPIRERLSCGMALRPSDGLLYPALLGALGVVLPWALTAGALASLASHAARARRRRRRLEEAALQRGSQRGVPAVAPPPGEETRLHLLAAVVGAQYLLLVAPGAGLASLPPLLARGAPADGWLPVSTGAHDAACLWARYVFPSAAAAAGLALVKEARKRCEAVLCARAGDNGVAQLDRAPASRYARAAHYRTPVLFATSEGLHLRVVRAPRGPAAEPGFACEFCDLAIVSAPAAGRRSALPAPPLFGPEPPPAEGDLRLSDSLTSAGDDQVCDLAAERRARHAPRKVVRFAQTVSEIPTSAASGGDWGPQDELGADRYRQPPRFAARPS